MALENRSVELLLGLCQRRRAIAQSPPAIAESQGFHYFLGPAESSANQALRTLFDCLQMYYLSAKVIVCCCFEFCAVG
ncbi:MAG: hypothetical protein D6742_12115 [Cyanobacteria bacterium J069]|nr:MAG: hypothetical protein D6742_12115 [Cyanobacteria bacterium J069]